MGIDLSIGKTLVALLVLVNPLGAIPIFISLTPNNTQAERNKIAKTAAIAVVCVMFFFALLGDAMLRFINVSIGSFQVGGGILVMLIAIAMMNAKQNPTKTTPEEENEAENKVNIAVVPLAIPLLTGPGTMSTMIIYSSAAQGWWETGQVLIAGALVAITCYVSMILATPISKWLGQTGINIINRIMGMILAAVSVEIIVKGLYSLFPQLAKHI